MTASRSARFPEIVKAHEQEVLEDWIERQLESIATRRDLIGEDDLRRQSRDFLNAFVDGALKGGLEQPHGPTWSKVREQLAHLSRTHAQQGFSPSETATFVLSLKRPLFDRLRRTVADPW
jgi:rsbT co-antagonist protein RsbR